MSAIVLGKRSSCIFEDLHLQSAPSSVSKKARFGSSSFRFTQTVSSAARNSQTVIEHLKSLFPDMDEEVCVVLFNILDLL